MSPGSDRGLCPGRCIQCTSEVLNHLRNCARETTTHELELILPQLAIRDAFGRRFFGVHNYCSLLHLFGMTFVAEQRRSDVNQITHGDDYDWAHSQARLMTGKNRRGLPLAADTY
jgi:hypothetical protein